MAKKAKTFSVSAIPITQGDQTFYLFSMPASRLWELTQINQRSEEKDEGYQRTLSQSRVRQVARYLKGNGIVPGSIVVSFKSGKYVASKKMLILPNAKDSGWIIDGHRETDRNNCLRKRTSTASVGSSKNRLERLLEIQKLFDV